MIIHELLDVDNTYSDESRHRLSKILMIIIIIINIVVVVVVVVVAGNLAGGHSIITNVSGK